MDSITQIFIERNAPILDSTTKLCILFIYSNEQEGGSPTEILISSASGQPIYNQIHTQIKALILSGQLHEGDILPSIRALARDLRISVITTKRAYDELEQEGLVYTVAGKGCFATRKNIRHMQEETRRVVESKLHDVHSLAKACGLSTEEVINLYRALSKEEL